MGTPYLGEIRMFGGNFAPQGWAFCNGQVLSIAENDALFTLIGTTYGGDGQTTFALPDLRGRAPVHMGQGPGLSNYTIGQAAGSETVTLITNQLPAHSHPPAANSSTGTSTSPAGNVWAASKDLSPFTTVPNTNMNSGAMGMAGGSQPHDNLPPYLTISFIISLFGIFPSQN